jgi:hypothetical protein
MKRRHVLQVAAGSTLTPWAWGQASAPVSAMPPASSASVGPGIATAEPTPQSWMDQWMLRWRSTGRDVEGLLYLGRFADPTYFLTKEITWKPNADQQGLPKVTVPIGFVTDFASIPRAFWSLLRPDGNYAYAAVIHDYLYWTQRLSRDKSDLIFKLAMQDFEIGSAEVSTIYAGVRAGGEGAWNDNAKLRLRGEKRILKTPPTDPRITWEDYKRRPGVFR